MIRRLILSIFLFGYCCYCCCGLVVLILSSCFSKFAFQFNTIINLRLNVYAFGFIFLFSSFFVVVFCFVLFESNWKNHVLSINQLKNQVRKVITEKKDDDDDDNSGRRWRKLRAYFRLIFLLLFFLFFFLIVVFAFSFES